MERNIISSNSWGTYKKLNIERIIIKIGKDAYKMMFMCPDLNNDTYETIPECKKGIEEKLLRLQQN